MSAVAYEYIAVAAVFLIVAVDKLAVFYRQIGPCTILCHNAYRRAIGFCTHRLRRIAESAILKNTIFKGYILNTF